MEKIALYYRSIEGGGIIETGSIKDIIRYIEKERVFEYPLSWFEFAKEPDFSHVDDLESLQIELSKFATPEDLYTVEKLTSDPYVLRYCNIKNNVCFDISQGDIAHICSHLEYSNIFGLDLYDVKTPKELRRKLDRINTEDVKLILTPLSINDTDEARKVAGLYDYYDY